jgi:hypothetical protein
MGKNKKRIKKEKKKKKVIRVRVGKNSCCICS